MVLERIRERGFTIADLSRALNKNDAYMHQYIWRGSPEWLREVDRAIVCRMLEIPEDQLRPPMPDLPPVPVRRASFPVPATVDTPARDVPLFREDDDIVLGATGDRTYRIPGLVPGPVFAIWIASEHGRFGPGDVIHLHQRQPPRIGDHVIAIANRRIIAIGRLVGVAEDGTRRIQGASGQNTSAPIGATTYKVVAAIYP